MIKLFLFFWIALLGTNSFAVNYETWSEDELYPWPYYGKFTHELNITAITFKNTGWTKQEIKERQILMASVFSQCGIKISKVTFLEMNSPTDKIDIHFADYDVTDGGTFLIAKALRFEISPYFFYMRNTEGPHAFSYFKLYTGGVIPLDGTAWMNTKTKEFEKKHYSPNISLEAHELGHILGNCGHYEDTYTNTRRYRSKLNFLSGSPRTFNNSITNEQCAVMKMHPAVRLIQ